MLLQKGGVDIVIILTYTALATSFAAVFSCRFSKTHEFGTSAAADLEAVGFNNRSYYKARCAFENHAKADAYI